MTGSPIDTIREALEHRQWAASCTPSRYGEQEEAAMGALLAALTEVEHQLEAGLPILSIDGRYVLTSKWAKEQARAVAAETALAECRGRTPDGQVLDPYEAACLRADEAEAELSETNYHLNHCRGLLEAAERRANDYEAALRDIASLPAQSEDWHENDVAVRVARAALDRQEQT